MTVEQAIDNIAAKIVARRLETPAVFLLVANKPVSFLAGQSMLAFDHVLSPFIGEYSKSISEILSDRKNVEKLIQKIESLSKAPEAGKV